MQIFFTAEGYLFLVELGSLVNNFLVNVRIIALAQPASRDACLHYVDGYEIGLRLISRERHFPHSIGTCQHKVYGGRDSRSHSLARAIAAQRRVANSSKLHTLATHCCDDRQLMFYANLLRRSSSRKSFRAMNSLSKHRFPDPLPFTASISRVNGAG